jgi:hypothetical protein
VKHKLVISLLGYSLLVYILLLLPFNLYTPTSYFDLPNILWFIHLMLLYVHEAGHFLFSPFGDMLRIMGGSLMQILAPVAWYFVARREVSSLANVAIFFTGVSVVDVSLYVKDAEVLKLPLIGSLSKAHHDWRNLLNQWEMVDYGHVFGEILFWSGMVLSVYGIYSGVKATIVLYKTTSVEKNITPDS